MKLLLRRHGDGIGDWLMMLECMKHLNIQHPDIEIYVDFTLERISNYERELPSIVKEAFSRSDVLWKEKPKEAIGYDVQIPHVVYKRLGTSGYVEGMLRQLGDAIDRDIVLNEACVPRYTFPWISDGSRDAVVLGTQGKTDTSHKDWGFNNFQNLAFMLKSQFVVQMGAANDDELDGAVAFCLGQHFETVAAYLAACKVFVGLENGLAVLAGHLDVPRVVIYKRSANVGRLTTARAHALVNPTPAGVYEYLRGMVRADL